MEIPYIVKLVGAFAVLLSVIPVTGLLCFGNVKQAWAYTKDWLRVMGFIFALAAIAGLVFWPFI